MDIPSTRELELETLLRTRDTQISELNDEVNRLRQYLTTQPSPSTADPITLPPSLVSVLLPQLQNYLINDSDAPPALNDSIYAALIRRTKLLQEENEELYDTLKRGETGRLKEEVHGLQRVVDKLQKALRDSHQVINSLSNELEKSYETFMTAARQNNNVKTRHHSPRDSYQGNNHSQTAGNGSPRHLPTGPRAHKKPRLSEPQDSPPARAAPPPQRSHKNSGNVTSARHHESSERSQSSSSRRANNAKMQVDEDTRTRPRSPSSRDHPSHRDFTRERESRDHDQERFRDRDRDTGRNRRNGNHFTSHSSRGVGGGGGGGRRPDRGGSTNTSGNNSMTTHSHSGSGVIGPSTDRTLAERMGL